MDFEKLFTQMLSSRLSGHKRKPHKHYGHHGYGSHGHGGSHGGVQGALGKAAFSKGGGLSLLAGIGMAVYQQYKASQTHAAPHGSGYPPQPQPYPPQSQPYSSHPVPPHQAQPYPPQPASGPWQTPGAGAAPPPFPGSMPPPSSPPAELLLLAMIEAAKADGYLDAEERGRILGHLDEAGAGPAERAWVERAMAAPADPDALVARATDPAVRAEIYAASLLAIEPDTEAERTYLAWLAGRLGLPRATIADIERRLAEAGRD
ncbi:MAG TPA: DUF533 domain-containing protein [Azospirillaceae bacterium]|nr:DUF533 domain-containing protein [Azospirillaceae bacterium]